MTEEEFENLKRSIQSFGFAENVVANKDGTIISGHQRIRAAEALGMEMVPVYFVDLSKEMEKAMNIAMNKIRGDWDLEKLTEVLNELPAPIIELAGYTADELQDLNFIKDFTIDGENKKQEAKEAKEPQEVTCPSCGHAFFLNPSQETE